MQRYIMFLGWKNKTEKNKQKTKSTHQPLQGPQTGKTLFTCEENKNLSQ